MPSSKSEEGVLLFKIMRGPRVGLFRAIPPTPPRYLLEYVPRAPVAPGTMDGAEPCIHRAFSCTSAVTNLLFNQLPLTWGIEILPCHS